MKSKLFCYDLVWISKTFFFQKPSYCLYLYGETENTATDSIDIKLYKKPIIK